MDFHEWCSKIFIINSYQSAYLRTGDVGVALHAADTCRADLSASAVTVVLTSGDTEARGLVTETGAVAATGTLHTGDLRVTGSARWTAALHAVIDHAAHSARATRCCTVTRICYKNILSYMSHPVIT